MRGWSLRGCRRELTRPSFHDEQRGFVGFQIDDVADANR
jgi:hypothetical protein